MKEFKVHPAAEAYRMMTEEELGELAADILANGLIDPIVITEHEGQDVIVDGRNRFKACESIGVEPRFEKLNGIDARTFVAARGKRRNISKGQQAIALAMLYPEPEEGGRGKNIESRKAAESAGFSSRRLAQARAILRHSVEIAGAVRDGVRKFDEALEEVNNSRAAQNSAETILARLRAEAPDLADLVDDEQLALNEASAALEQRIRDAEAEEKSRRDTYLRITAAAYHGNTSWANPEFVTALRERLSDDKFRAELIKLTRLDPAELPHIKAGAKALIQVLTELSKEI